ncbi:MAG: hypothetical protein K0S11_1739 [Gammaproteobacteria bacterium]|jgi:threonine/homoserine/homoserine lactone efflux protein|nr:hypothetical protein [Gammaproteobacteria bacterium]
MEWGKILAIIVALVLVWLSFRALRANPEMLSKENLSKSFSTMGLLALILLGFIGLCIYLLRAA